MTEKIEQSIILQGKCALFWFILQHNTCYCVYSGDTLQNACPGFAGYAQAERFWERRAFEEAVAA